MPTHDFRNIGDVLDFELLQGTITAIDAATDTCTVSVGGELLTALLFYHCTSTSGLRDNGAIEGAAKGFSVGSVVIVLKKYDNSSVKVIGHVSGIRRCVEAVVANYYIFYKSGTSLNVARCTYEDGTITKVDEMGYSTLCYNTVMPVKFHLKRFTHNVITNGVSTARDLYFIATSLYINPYITGWVNFASENPDFALVTNNLNTQLTMTDALWTDMQSVNSAVNSEFVKAPETVGDTWKILSSGESGDCEDFALTKAKRLLDLGYAASALHIETGIINDGGTSGHAWLVVQTTAGDYALDVNTDTVVANTSLKYGEYEIVLRRRQIGPNWAYMSSYSWLMEALNTWTGAQEGGITVGQKPVYYFYVFDPLLNILYNISFTGYPGDFQGYFPYFFESTGLGSSVNFSVDNNYIYVFGYRNGYYIKYVCRLLENNLSITEDTSFVVSTTFIDRDGSLVTRGSYTTTIVSSPDGYYSYAVIPSLFSWVIGMSNICMQQSGSYFYWEQVHALGVYTNKYYPPYESEKDGPLYTALDWPTSTYYDDYWVPSFLSHIQTSSLFLQAYYWKKGNTVEKKVFDNGSSCLSAFTDGLGITEENLLGITYMPFTQRL